MTTLAAKIMSDGEARYRNRTTPVSAQEIADDYLKLTEIVKLYAEGKVSAKEVSEAQNARAALTRFFMTATSADISNMPTVEFAKATLLHEMCVILKISEDRFGTKQGMSNILADPYLSAQFVDEERAELRKIADGFSFLAHERLKRFLGLILAKYRDKGRTNNIDDEINKLDLRPIKSNRRG
jgi:hypothetical protein